MAVVQAEITIGGLHPGQYEVLQDESRFQVLAAGRRWGKTRMGGAKLVSSCVRLPGWYWWVFPDYPRSEEGWWVLNEFARAFPAQDVRIEKTERRIWLPGGGHVQVKSADDPNSLRGRGLRGVVNDEYAFQKVQAWPALRPALAEHQGWALFISSPKGLNHFYTLFQDAQSEARKRAGWVTWQRPTSENPKVPAEEIAALRMEMGSQLAAQELDAQFISTAGVFRQDWFRTYWYEGDFFLLNDPELGRVRRIHRDDLWTFVTVDPAASEKEAASYFVACVWAVTKENDLLLIHREREHAETTKHLPILRRLWHGWRGLSFIGVERAHVGLALIQAAVREGLPIRAIPAERDKVSRARVAAARYEAGKVYHPAHAPWLQEWEWELLGFPDGAYDDQVDNVAYACIQIAAAGGSFRWGPSPLR